MANAQVRSMDGQLEHHPARLVAPPAQRATNALSVHPSGISASRPRKGLLASLFGALAGIGLVYHSGQDDALFVTGAAALLAAATLFRWSLGEVRGPLARHYAELGLPAREAEQRAAREAVALCAQLTRASAPRAPRSPIELD